MRSPSLVALAAALCLAAPISAQQYLLAENFESGSFPPAGWALLQNGVSLGWQDGGIAGQPGTAFHDDFAGAGGTSNSNLLHGPALDLSGLQEAWVHFDNRLRWATFLANHPQGSGNGVSTLEVSSDGGATWAGAWMEARTLDGVELTSVDISAWAGQPSVQVGFLYEGDFAHEWTVDRVYVGESSSPPPPPGTPWTVNLPTAFAPTPLLEDFDAAAGVLQPHMAVTALVSSTLQPSPLAWCNIGQMGALVTSSYSGSYHLEMGLAPGSPGGTYVRNAFVIGVDNSAGLQALELQLRARDFGEEADPIDGIWISIDGGEWYLLSDWGPAGSQTVWTLFPGLDLEAAPVPVDGTFYLMFAQEDNFPFGNQDGIAVDDIEVGGDPPPSPTIATTSTCPGSMFLDIQGCTPGGTVGIGWAVAAGTTAVPAGPCAGLSLDLYNAKRLGAVPASASGTILWQVQVPAQVCGTLHLQVVDVESCVTSPVLVL